MTQIIKEQLELLAIKNPECDGNKIIFRKNGNLTAQQKQAAESTKSTETLIELSDWFLKPDIDFHQTVNKGKLPPKHKQLYITTVKSTEKSVYVIGHYEDESWDGWIPKKCFTIIN